MSRRGVFVALAGAALALAAGAAFAQTGSAPPGPAPGRSGSLTEPPYDPALPPKGIPDGFALVEGDVLVRVSDLATRRAGRYGAFTTFGPGLWPAGTVPYEFDANTSIYDRQQALAAMALWTAIGTGGQIHFVPRTTETAYVHIQSSTGNNSAIGRLGYEQIINILDWDNLYVIAHELNHTLGRYHEQSRLDRDNYIIVNYGNVCQNCCAGASCDPQFDKRNEGGDYGPYDFDSVMHYNQCSFSSAADCPANGITITVKPPYDTTWQSQIGQRDHLSRIDVLNTSFMYAPADWRFVDPSRGGSDANAGGFFAPWWDSWKGLQSTPSGGTVYIEPGVYFGNAGTFSTPMTVQAPNGLVWLQ
jgi:hypothetical protein